MAIKAISEMTKEELDALRGKKPVKPLFELTPDNRKNSKPDSKKVEKPIAEEQNIDNNIDKVSKFKQKRSRKEKNLDTIAQNLDSNLDKNVQIEKKKRKKEVNLDTHVDGDKPLSKKEKRLARLREKEEEAKLYPNETKKERKARLKREKYEADAIKMIDEADAKEAKSIKHTKSKSGRILYDEDANKRLAEIYNDITIKKSKKQQEYDEVFRKHLKANGLMLGLHINNTGSERFSMIGKLVEKGYAKHKGYCMDYHLYELFS